MNDSMSELNEMFSQERNLALSEDAVIFLKETARWAKLISIVGFVMLGILVIGGFAAGAMGSIIPGSPFPAFTFTIIYLLIAVLYFFPLKYLYSFASGTKKAINERDEFALSEALRNLKSHYKFFGILTIIFLAIYAAGFIIGISAAIWSSF